MLSLTVNTSSLLAILLNSLRLGSAWLRSEGSGLTALLRPRGTMFWKRFLFFLQFWAISRLMLTCTPRLKEAMLRMALNSSKLSASCPAQRHSITPVVPRWVSQTTLSSKSSFSPIEQISKRRSSSRFGCFMRTMGMLELRRNSPLRTTPRACSQSTWSLRWCCLTTKSFFSQQWSTLVLSGNFSNAPMIAAKCSLTCGYSSSGTVLTLQRETDFMLEILYSNSTVSSQSPRKIGAETSIATWLIVTLAFPSSRKQKCEQKSPFLKKGRPGGSSARGRQSTSIIIIFIAVRAASLLLSAVMSGQQFKRMQRCKLPSPKLRLEERNASRVLEEESERLTDEFLHLFVADCLAQKQHHRCSAKLANWEDDLDRKRFHLDQNNSKKTTVPARYRFKRKRMATIESEGIEDSPGMKGATSESQNQPTFSISLLSPLMEECGRGRPSEKLRKMREKAASHLRSRFIQHLALIAEGRPDPPQTRNARVHSLNSEPSCLPARQVINFDNFGQPATKKQWPMEGESRSMESILKRKKRVEETLEGRRREKEASNPAEAGGSALPASQNPKFKKSKQFQKLRMLLTLEKI